MSDKEILEIEDFLEEGFNIIEEEIKDGIDKETEKNQKSSHYLQFAISFFSLK